MMLLLLSSVSASAIASLGGIADPSAILPDENFTNVVYLNNYFYNPTPVDKGPEKHTVSLTGTPVTSNTVLHDNSTTLLMDGASAVTVDGTAASGSIANAEDFTWEAWVFPTSLTTPRMVIGKSSSPTPDEGELYIDTTGAVRAKTFVGGVEDVSIVSTDLVTTASWHHVAFVRASGVYTLYVDGEIQTGSGVTGSVPDVGAGDVYIGGSATDASRRFFGHIGSTRITQGTARYTAAFTPPFKYPQEPAEPFAPILEDMELEPSLVTGAIRPSLNYSRAGQYIVAFAVHSEAATDAPVVVVDSDGLEWEMITQQRLGQTWLVALLVTVVTPGRYTIAVDREFFSRGAAANWYLPNHTGKEITVTYFNGGVSTDVPLFGGEHVVTVVAGTIISDTTFTGLVTDLEPIRFSLANTSFLNFFMLLSGKNLPGESFTGLISATTSVTTSMAMVLKVPTVGAPGPVIPAMSTVLINGGAESGDLTGWTGDVAVATEVVKSPSGTAGPRTGTYLFYGSPTNATSSMYQDVAIAESDLIIVDGGVGEVTLEWWQASFNEFDGLSATLLFYDSFGNYLGRDQNGPTMGAPIPQWTRFSQRVLIPKNTRRIRVQMDFTRTSGTSLNAYVDDISLTVRFGGYTAADNASTMGVLGTPLNSVAVSGQKSLIVMGTRTGGVAVPFSHTYAILE